jgi:gamma-glutamyltranspeptidase/glutathione hydrolase
MVLLGVLDLAAGNKPDSWVGGLRYHHQYRPDSVQYEPGAFDGALAAALVALGHRLKPLESGYGNMQAIYLDKHTRRVYAASDPRGTGAAMVE